MYITFPVPRILRLEPDFTRTEHLTPFQFTKAYIVGCYVVFKFFCATKYFDLQDIKRPTTFYVDDGINLVSDLHNYSC